MRFLCEISELYGIGALDTPPQVHGQALGDIYCTVGGGVDLEFSAHLLIPVTKQP